MLSDLLTPVSKKCHSECKENSLLTRYQDKLTLFSSFVYKRHCYAPFLPGGTIIDQ